MNEKPKPNPPQDWKGFSDKIASDTKRRQKAQKNKEQGIWSGLGMMGLIGWSVAVPTLAGAALGVWLDSISGANVSWTLTMIILGLAAGSFNAWHWLSKEGKEIDQQLEDQEQEDDDE